MEIVLGIWTVTPVLVSAKMLSSFNNKNGISKHNPPLVTQPQMIPMDYSRSALFKHAATLLCKITNRQSIKSF